MKNDVEQWWKDCLNCMQLRGVPRKQEQVAVVPTNRDCFQEVMIDIEGPSNPADKMGNKYVLTYICCLCYAILLEPLQKLNANKGSRELDNESRQSAPHLEFSRKLNVIQIRNCRCCLHEEENHTEHVL